MKMYQKCPLCSGRLKESLHGLKGYWYCEKCKFGKIMKNPKVVYKRNYYQGKSGLISQLFTPIGSFFYHLRSSYIATKDPKTWVDVGAGDGEYLKTVPSPRKIGVEVSAAGRNMMKKSGLGTLRNTDFLKAKNLNADVITFWHVLEHVEDPFAFLESARRNLNKGGEIIIGVPNVDSIEFSLFKKNWFHLVPAHHIWYFSPESLSKIVNKYQFTVKEIDNWSLEHHLTGILQSFVNATSGSDSVLHRLIKRRENLKKISKKDVFWSFFWLTIGLPIVILFWLAGSLFKRPGTFVLAAVKD